MRLITCLLTSLTNAAPPPSILCFDILASVPLRASLHARSGHGGGGGGGGLSLALSLSVQPFKYQPVQLVRGTDTKTPRLDRIISRLFQEERCTGMSSLLENPLQAVLYLKELTAIVQNQQGLIQTQRYRIDILERRLEDLAVENRQLRDSSSHHRHPPRYHPPPPPRTSSLPRTSRAGTPPVQTQQQQQQQHHSPLDMQLVPTGPTNASPDSADEDDNDAQDPCCRSLVPQTSATLCRTVGLPRTSE